MVTWDRLWLNAHLATLEQGGTPYGAIENGALAIEGGRIAWLGPMANLPHREAAEIGISPAPGSRQG